MADSDSQGIAARFRSVFFSYDREVELSEAGESNPDSDGEVTPPAPDGIDPDARGGPVLRGVDLDIPDDSFTVVMGASGGGKSTLVRCLNAVVPRHYRGNFAGTVEVLGREASDSKISEMARMAGMVMQNYEAQLFGTSIESEVAFGPENLNVDADRIGDRIDRMLELVELDDLNRHRPPAGLSGGQKQRLVVAAVLAMHPRLLILDEPTSDLDPRGTRDLLDIIQRLSRDRNTTLSDSEWNGPETFVMVTHKIEEAVLADHAVLLKDGKEFRSGPARRVFTDVEALEEARVAVPPLVETFDRLGVPRERLPLTPDDALDVAADSGLTWRPPGTAGDELANPTRTGESVGGVLFDVEGLSRTFHTDREDILALDDVDLTVRDGEFVAIVGHNGSGKTTLAKHMNGLMDPQTGSVRWKGQEIADLSMSEIGRHMGYVFQNPDHQLFASTVREELEFGPRNFGFEGEKLDAQVRRATETIDLEPLLEADPFNLSKGQRQRVALGGILATDPEVIIFDEPTTGLDAPQARQFMDLVARLNREEDMTVVMVTHDMQTVARYAPRTVVMEEGRKVADRRTRYLFADTEALADWDLMQPQQIELSNRLADVEGALPAMSVEELVEGLGGANAAPGAGGES